MSDEPVPLLVLASGGAAFAFDLTAVREVRRHAEVTPLPDGASAHGLLASGGERRPVYALARLLGRGTDACSPDSPVVVVAAGDAVFGLLVDAVKDLAAVPGRDVRDVPKHLADAAAGAIVAVALCQGRMVAVLSPERLFKLADTVGE